MRGVRVLLSLVGLALAGAVGASSAQESAPEPPNSSPQGPIDSPVASPRQPTDPAGRAYRPPTWRSKPRGEDWSSAYPPAANRKGLGGRATVRCQVTIRGELSDCVVTSESPAGEGFGKAALQMTGHMLMKPAMLDGKPVPSRIVIPISFQPAPEPQPGFRDGKPVRILPAIPVEPGDSPALLPPVAKRPPVAPPPRRLQPDWARITACAALSLDEADRRDFPALTRDSSWYAAYFNSGLQRSKAPGALLSRLEKAMDEARASRRAPDRLVKLRQCDATLRAFRRADPAEASDP